MKRKAPTPPPVQAGLFDSCDVHTLAAQVERPQAQKKRLTALLAWQKKVYQRLQEEYAQVVNAKLEDADHPLCTKYREAERTIADLRTTLRTWIERHLGALRRDNFSPTKGELTRLLTLYHPDKWSQGQPASQLAHEISVMLNGLRERGQI